MHKGFDRHEIMKEDYIKNISSWDWDGLKKACENSEPFADLFNMDDQDSLIYSCFIGTVFAIMPSGKFYMPWTTNQTKHDWEKDSAFYDALEEVADNHGMFVFHGEGDPCDMFIGYCK